MMLSGLGGLKPNTVVLPLAKHSALEVVGCVRDALNLGLNVCVAANFGDEEAPATSSGITAPLLGGLQLAKRFSAGRGGGSNATIDVWVLGDWDFSHLHGTLSLQLQLAYVLSSKAAWREARIRIINAIAADADGAIEAAEKKLDELLLETRIEAERLVVVAPPALEAQCLRQSRRKEAPIHRASSSLTANVERWTGGDREMRELNALIAAHSAGAKIVFACLPGGRSHISEMRQAELYVDAVASLTKGLPPCILVSAGSMVNIITNEI